MKILIFTHNYPISSQERRNAGTFVHDFSVELAKMNTVTVICPGSYEKRERFGAVDVYFFGWRGEKHLGKLKFWNPIDLFYGLNLFFRGIKVLLSVTRETKPDFCLAMWAIPGGIFAYFTKVMLGIPYAVWVLGSDFYVYSKIPLLGFFIRHVMKGAKYRFADGISLSQEVSKTVNKKCFFLPSGTNFSFPAVERKIKQHDKLTLTFVGRMEEVKGPDILIDALAEIKRKVRSIRVNFVGDGSLLPQLKRRVEEERIEKSVNFYGNVDDKKKIAQILINSDWLVIPSRSDTIPLVFSEGMKVGIPVIASALFDLRYLIDKYAVGIHFKPEDRLGLANILLRLPSMKKQHSAFAHNTKKVAKLFSVEKSAGRLVEMIS